MRAGTVLAGPTDVTTGHSPPDTQAFDASSTDPAAAPLLGGFVALWNEPLSGTSQIYGRIYDGSGAVVASLSPLTPTSLRRRPALVGVGGTFAASWKDATNRVLLARYDGTGTAMTPEVVLTTGAGGPPNTALDWSGEQFGVAWVHGGSVRFQRATSAAALVGSQTTIGAGVLPPGPQVQWIGSGWALAWNSNGNLFFARLNPDGSTAVGPLQLTTSSAVTGRFELEWNGAALGLGWQEARLADPPGQDVYFTVLDANGVKAFPDLVVAGSPYSDGSSTLYWSGGSFHVVHNYGLGWLRDVPVTPTGSMGAPQLLSNRGGAVSVAGNGATAGIVWAQLQEMYFETTACLADVTPASCPIPSATFDGQKVSLTWTAAVDPESGVYQYHVYRDGNLLAEQDGTSLAIDDPGFVPGASHAYSVRPLNGAYLEPASCPSTTIFTGTADVSATNTDGQASAVPGQAATYTIVAANAGPDPVAGAVVTDTLPSALVGATWTCAASPGASCTPSGNGSIADTVTLPVGGTATYTLTATIDPSASGSLTNTASIALPTGGNDPAPANNASSDTDTLTPQADLAVFKSDSPDPVASGGALTYTIQVTNLGPSSSTGMAMVDVLPASVSFVSVNPGAPTCIQVGPTVSCNLGGLLPAVAHTVTIQVTVNAGTVGTISNTASATGNEPDPVSVNNSDTEPTTVVGTSDLSIAKTDGQATAVPGQPVTYTIAVTNAGPRPLQGPAWPTCSPPCSRAQRGRARHPRVRPARRAATAASTTA